MPAKRVIFADPKVEKAYNELAEDDWLKKAINRAIQDCKENAFCGERIKKDQIPQDYIKKYGIDNLSWYPLPKGWRLVYSIAGNSMEIVAIIIEYYNHKDYERRFGY